MAYATPIDLTRLGLPAAALDGIAEADQLAALSAASGVADGYLAARFRLPLTEWGDDLRRAVCQIAAYDLLTTRGIAPDSPEAILLGDRSKAAMAWLRDISDSRVTPTVTESAPAVLGGSRVTSAPMRGW